MTPAFNMLGVAGSLRTQSHNRALLASLAHHLPDDISITVFEGLSDISPLNEDDEAAGVLKGVPALWSAIRAADGVVFATPEYNQSLPGVMKNAIDWITRDPAGSPLSGKPVAVTGATVGAWGTRLAQQQLRTVLTACGAIVMPSPSIYVSRAGVDAITPESLVAFADATAAWTRRHAASSI